MIVLFSGPQKTQWSLMCVSNNSKQIFSEIANVFNPFMPNMCLWAVYMAKCQVLDNTKEFGLRDSLFSFKTINVIRFKK